MRGDDKAPQTTIRSFAGAKDALLNSNLRQSLYDAGKVIMADTLLTLHGDEHRLRRTTEFQVFGRGFFRHYEQDVFPQTLATTLRPFIEQGFGDLVDIGYRVTINLTADFAGVDRPLQTAEETDLLKKIITTFGEGSTLVHTRRDPDVVECEVREMLDVFEQTFYRESKERRDQIVARVQSGQVNAEELPRDLMSVLLSSQSKLGLSPAQLLREIAFFLQAGSHSTANSTVHAFHEIFSWCAKRPDDWRRIEKDPLFLQRCVHESFRLHPASPVAWRTTMCPVVLAEGGEVSEGTRIVIDMFGANRDRTVFGDDADEFNPYRRLPNGVWPFGLTFGYGVHACLGRDLDGGVIAGDGVDPLTHQYGTVTLFLRALLERGARPDPDAPPTPDVLTERPNWGTYPIRLSELS